MFFKRTMIYSFLLPLVLALYPIAFAFWSNACEVYWLELIALCGVAFVVTISIFFINYCFFRNYEKAGIFSSVIIFLFWHLTIFSNFITRFKIFGIAIRARYVLLLTFLLLFVLAIILFRLKKKNFVFPKIFLFLFLTVMMFYWLMGIFHRVRTYYLVQNYLRNIEVPVSSHNKDLPNIYYIILDAHASEGVLESRFGKKTEVVEDLKKRGFFIANNSFSNYSYTIASLASSLNMIHLDSLDFLKGHLDFDSLGALLRDNVVMNFLKKQGYKTILISPPAERSRDLKNICSEKSYSIWGEFTTNSLLRDSCLNFGGKLMHPFWTLFSERHYQNWILYQLDQLKRSVENKGPCFVFAHLLCPHSPFLFDEHGNRVSHSRLECSYHSALYGHCAFIGDEIVKVVDHILNKSIQRPIIIIQGDHGFSEGLFFLKDELSIKKINTKEIFGILNAFYVPPEVEKKLYDSISPVNLFRVLLNHYFETSFDLLPDKSYMWVQNRLMKVDESSRS